MLDNNTLGTPQVIGITGGIGSGKSIVCKVFALLGIPVYDADTRAKLLVNESDTLKQAITALLGTYAYTSSGVYNRSWVASQVFGNPDLLQQLNALIHPAVRQDARNWIAQNSQAPYLLYEAALLKGAGNGNNFQKVIVVIAPTALRIKRVLQRDRRSEEEIKNIINRQSSDEERKAFADIIIQNDDATPLIPQILQIHQALINTGTKKEVAL